MMPTSQSSASETQIVTVEALMPAVDPFVRNLTPKERKGLANGNPEPSTTSALQETYGTILELLTSIVLLGAPKERRTMKDLKAAVGNAVPETFAKVLGIDKDLDNEHNQNLNRLIVQHLLKVISLDSEHDQKVARMSIISHMVDETLYIMEDFLYGSYSPEPADVKTCRPKKKSKGLTGTIRRFFRNLIGKRSAKVAPMIIIEEPETSLSHDKENIEVEDSEMSAAEASSGDSDSDIEGCEEDYQLATDIKTPVMVDVEPLDVPETPELGEAEPEDVEPFVPLDVQEEPEDVEPFLPLDVQEEPEAVEPFVPLDLQEEPEAVEPFVPLDVQEEPEAGEPFVPLDFQATPELLEEEPEVEISPLEPFVPQDITDMEKSEPETLFLLVLV